MITDWGWRGQRRQRRLNECLNPVWSQDICKYTWFSTLSIYNNNPDDDDEDEADDDNENETICMMQYNKDNNVVVCVYLKGCRPDARDQTCNFCWECRQHPGWCAKVYVCVCVGRYVIASGRLYWSTQKLLTFNVNNFAQQGQKYRGQKDRRSEWNRERESVT